MAAKIKHTPRDGFAPRGQNAKVLGCVDNVTSGVLVGNFDGADWELEVVSSYVLHDTVEAYVCGDQTGCSLQAA